MGQYREELNNTLQELDDLWTSEDGDNCRHSLRQELTFGSWPRPA